jgi:hypothetical protein
MVKYPGGERTVDAWTAAQAVQTGTHSSNRNEDFLSAHIYTPDGVLTHSLLAFSAITVQNFLSFWQEIRSPITSG